MKKLIAILVVLFAVAITTQTVKAGEMRYIEKQLETHFGVDCSFWLVEEIEIQLSKNPTARVRIAGFASSDAYKTGKPALGHKFINIDNVESLITTIDTTGDKNLYELVAGKIIEVVLADEQFSGGTIKTFQTE